MKRAMGIKILFIVHHILSRASTRKQWMPFLVGKSATCTEKSVTCLSVYCKKKSPLLQSVCNEYQGTEIEGA